VRIGEFAWSRIEPDPEHFNWDWLQRALDTLGGAGLKVVLGTPTATPPKWLIDRHPDILPVDRDGRPRRFGSRRHYDFSSPTYRQESVRIVTALAERFGSHDAVAGWQTDNEYGCHDTVLSYSPAATRAFRVFLKQRYDTPEALNEAWGNRFWSLEYRLWDEIDLPNLTVTEASPAHWLDFRRFASEQVDLFNRAQMAIIRRFSPGRFVTHNFMGQFLEFDHFKVGQPLDLASWDSYPLGFTDRSSLDEATKRRFAETGHPDIAAFSHDLYRAVGKGRFWVMEQQPGPVNWAAWNPAPAPGMVRLWTWEALAHGAEVVSYFRWRQAPFAQEQMHSGLNRPDGGLDTGGEEAARVAEELAGLDLPEPVQAPVALVFDYEAAWISQIQPQGRDFDYYELVTGWYMTLRRRGLDIDIVPAGAPLDGYRAVVVPSLPLMRDKDLAAFRRFEGPILFGPRTGSKTETFGIPEALPPGPLAEILPIRVTRVESLRPGSERGVAWGNRRFAVPRWAETIDTELEPLARFDAGGPALVGAANRLYLAGWPEAPLREAVAELLIERAGLTAIPLPEGLRLRRRGGLTFAFNYGPETVELPAPKSAVFRLGGPRLEPYEVALWTTP
ncbi:MAG: beta-galactosidase, partial [Inquilinus sp.]|nr:beta-galactosidase [Inquilinus sp.]